jgi:hypothetical protein
LEEVLASFGGGVDESEAGFGGELGGLEEEGDDFIVDLLGLELFEGG